MLRSLVGSEMCIRDRSTQSTGVLSLMGRKKSGPMVSECGCCDHHEHHEPPPAVLSEQELVSVPWPELDEENCLRELHLESQELELRVRSLQGSIDPKVSACLALVSLQLINGGITQLPPSLAQLVNLRSLVLSSNQLSWLPHQLFAGMTSLTALILDHNNLTATPPSICRLVSLQVLNLSGNFLRELPDGIGMLSSLLELDLSQNCFDVLPISTTVVPSLRELRAARNQIVELPNQLARSQVTYLDLSHNCLAELPYELKTCKLKTLLAHGNPFRNKKLLKQAENGAGPKQLLNSVVPISNRKSLSRTSQPPAPTTKATSSETIRLCKNSRRNWRGKHVRTMESSGWLGLG
eukprot:TRINITY_DN6990_c0_g1_i4.p1 TRINITY_DN6990_c0_g1~~TRINITY_DN6990_c0_g1_i4.p1  ORF type:complete len:352 (+),score=56.25 TRINITY_DN6990_c0_g1_i4:136-1191(+)